MKNLFYSCLFLFIPIISFSQNFYVQNTTLCDYLVTYYVDNGTPCIQGAPGTQTTICFPPTPPILVATNVAPVDHLFVSIVETDPGCIVSPAACWGSGYNLGFPPSFLPCPNFSGFPDFIFGVPVNCGSCSGNPPVNFQIVQIAANDYRLDIY